MRSCTPGNERALSVKTVPRIRKSFTWLYIFLPGLLRGAAGACELGAEPDGRGIGSWAGPNAALNEATSAAVQRIVIHCARCIRLLLAILDGGKSSGGCQAGWRVPVNLRLLFSFGLNHLRR